MPRRFAQGWRSNDRLVGVSFRISVGFARCARNAGASESLPLRCFSSVLTGRRVSYRTAILLLIFLYACAGGGRPDLERLYRLGQTGHQPPVILIHGILGARLIDGETGEEVWYGSLPKLVFSDYADTALQIDPQTLEPLPTRLIPSGLAEKAAGKDFYSSIIRTLEGAGGYRRSVSGTPQAPGARNYYLFLYDWRQDNVLSAQKLSRFIKQIRRDYSDPNLKVDLIAHSMGGLIARYYLRYGELDTLDDNEFPVNLHGAERVRRVILLGTPNFGSVQALHAFIKGRKIGLNRLPTEALASMPSVYQTFPHSINHWLITAEGKPLDRDLFDVRIWRRFQWSIFNPEVRRRILDGAENGQAGPAHLATLERYFEKRLERARRFVWALTVPLPEAHHKLIVFGGDCELTPARLLVEEVNGVSEIRLWPEQVSNPLPGVDYDQMMLEPGDGTVTKASLLARHSLDPFVARHRYVDFPLDYSFFLCERHDALTGNVSFQDNLLHALLSVDSP